MVGNAREGKSPRFPPGRRSLFSYMYLLDACVTLLFSLLNIAVEMQRNTASGGSHDSRAPKHRRFRNGRTHTRTCTHACTLCPLYIYLLCSISSTGRCCPSASVSLSFSLSLSLPDRRHLFYLLLYTGSRDEMLEGQKDVMTQRIPAPVAMGTRYKFIVVRWCVQ